MVSKLNRVTSLNDFVSSDAPICYGILKPGEHIPTGIPVIKVKNIKNGAILTKDLLHTSIEIDKQYSRSKLKTGDILLTIRGSTGRVAIVPKSLNGSNITQDTARIRVSTSDDLTYLFYALHAPKTQQQINLNTVGQAVKGINISEVKKLKIYHPPLPEQRKIAQILSTWDRGIATTEKLIDASKQQKKALMQQLLTGEKRLVDPKTGKAFEGEWEDTTIATTSKCFSGGTPSRTKDEYYGGTIPWITSGKLNDRFVESVNEYITESGVSNSSAKYVKQGALLVAMYGATAGKVAINRLQTATINQAILALEVKGGFSNIFLFYLLEREMEKTLNLVQGGQPNLNAAIIKGVKIKLPNIEEQQKIASVLIAADKEIELLKAKLAHFKQEKKALMQQLLTGKRRVSLSS